MTANKKYKKTDTCKSCGYGCKIVKHATQITFTDYDLVAFQFACWNVEQTTTVEDPVDGVDKQGLISKSLKTIVSDKIGISKNNHALILN